MPQSKLQEINRCPLFTGQKDIKIVTMLLTKWPLGFVLSNSFVIEFYDVNYCKQKLLDFVKNFSTAKLTISRLNKRVYLHKNHLHHQMFQRNKKKRIFIISNLMFAFTVFHNTILKHYICGATLHTSRTTRVYFIFEVHCYGVIVSCQKQSICSVFISIFTLNFLFLDWMNGWWCEQDRTVFATSFKGVAATIINCSFLRSSIWNCLIFVLPFRYLHYSGNSQFEQKLLRVAGFVLQCKSCHTERDTVMGTQHIYAVSIAFTPKVSAEEKRV